LLVSPVLILVKGRVATQKGSFEAGQRLLNNREGDGSRAEGLGKLGLINRILLNFLNRNVVRLIHFQRVGHRIG
jgi:hypothetical protein